MGKATDAREQPDHPMQDPAQPVASVFFLFRELNRVPHAALHRGFRADESQDPSTQL